MFFDGLVKAKYYELASSVLHMNSTKRNTFNKR